MSSKLKAKPPEEVKPGKTKALIYGASGVGKTWWSLGWPKPFFVDTEGGADLRHYQARLAASGGAYMGPGEGSLDFKTVLEQMEALATEKHGFKTFILDSVTKLFQTDIANESIRIESIGHKDEFGASKKRAIRMMRRLVNWTEKLDMNILFVAHEATEWGKDDRTGQRTEIGKVADCWDKLIYELDLTLQATKRGPQRCATVRKSRLLGFADCDTFVLDYPTFAERYGRDFIEADSKPIQLATPEQVAEIVRLVDLLKVTPEECAKVLTKAGAEGWQELTTEQAAATCKWLGKKITG